MLMRYHWGLGVGHTYANQPPPRQILEADPASGHAEGGNGGHISGAQNEVPLDLPPSSADPRDVMKEVHGSGSPAPSESGDDWSDSDWIDDDDDIHDSVDGCSDHEEERAEMYAYDSELE